ncbi:MAG: hypothetical protein AB7P40_05610 [Chloroflexota bacterium]
MKHFETLVVYARTELNAGDEYDHYRPKLETLRRIAALLPRAHVQIVSATWCKDCRRELPRFAAIIRHLDGWSVELLGDDPETRGRLEITRIPTFIVRSAGDGAAGGSDVGSELGRIVESPATGSLEDDLLAIAEAHPSQILA